MKVHKFRIIFEILLFHGFIMFEVLLSNIGQMHPEVSKSVFRIEKFEWEGLQIHEIKNKNPQNQPDFKPATRCTKIVLKPADSG